MFLQVEQHLDVSKLVDAMAKALQSYSAGESVQPIRTVVPAQQGFLAVMPAFLPGSGLGVKLVTFYPHNVDAPTHMATIMLFEPMTGRPLAIMEGGLLTELRTAACSAVATRLLAREDAVVLAILGTGTQARAHWRLLASLRAWSEVRVWGRTPANAQVSVLGLLHAALQLVAVPLSMRLMLCAL